VVKTAKRNHQGLLFLEIKFFAAVIEKIGLQQHGTKKIYLNALMLQNLGESSHPLPRLISARNKEIYGFRN
jgi:hypothetical protein